jgi:hypothetical protein
VAVALAITVGAYPRLNAPLAVEFTHMCVMKPASSSYVVRRALAGVVLDVDDPDAR